MTLSWLMMVSALQTFFDKLNIIYDLNNKCDYNKISKLSPISSHFVEKQTCGSRGGQKDKTPKNCVVGPQSICHIFVYHVFSKYIIYLVNCVQKTKVNGIFKMIWLGRLQCNWNVSSTCIEPELASWIILARTQRCVWCSSQYMMYS